MRLISLFIFLSISLSGFSQKYIGIRFASDINYFPNVDRVELVENAFTTGKLGLYYANYQKASGFELGLNVNYKDGNDKGFPNLPVVMRDWGQDQNVGYLGVEMDFKAGPRIWPIYPKIGYVLGYRFTQIGFITDPQSENKINPWYLMLPFGVSANLPTQWGLVGFGGFFNIGVLNVVNLPDQFSLRDGGRHRSFTFEMTMSIENRK
ncbi:MAG: hypothetical protein MRZ79_16045 [Bacteroidia bacterium]|nr:hypothetical protein [Bacteroidia bacterium]